MKLKLEYKSGFKCKKDTYTDEKNLHHSSLTVFEFRSSMLLEYGLNTRSRGHFGQRTQRIMKM